MEMTDIGVFALMLVSMFAGLVIVLVFLSTAFAADVVRTGGDDRAEAADPLTAVHVDVEPVCAPACCVQSLSEEDRNGFCHIWNSVCERFADDPRTAVTYADLLFSDLMLQCNACGPLTGNGFPGGEDRAFTDRYQTAHAMAVCGRIRNLNSEELAKAMDLYSGLFDNVLRARLRDERVAEGYPK